MNNIFETFEQSTLPNFISFLNESKLDVIEIDIKDLSWSKNSKSFTVEIAELSKYKSLYNSVMNKKDIHIVNHDTNKIVKFTYVKTDKDGSNEDTYGWRYEAKDREGSKISLLIIND